jgi:hypothetical protein
MMLTTSVGYHVPVSLKLKRRSAKGWQLVWAATSPQKAPPYKVHFAPDGKHVVLQDEWNQVGYGVALAFLGADGKTLRSYRLRDFLPEADILGAQTTTSSIWWDQHAFGGFVLGGERFAVVTARGTFRCFDVSTGMSLPITDRLQKEILGECVPIVRRQLSSKNFDERREAAYLCGTLRDRASVPELIRLLNDSSFRPVTIVQDSAVPNGRYRQYDVQIAAADSLLKIDLSGSKVLVKAKITGANRYMAQQFRRLLSSAAASE